MLKKESLSVTRKSLESQNVKLIAIYQIPDFDRSTLWSRREDVALYFEIIFLINWQTTRTTFSAQIGDKLAMFQKTWGRSASTQSVQIFKHAHTYLPKLIYLFT